MLCAFTAVNKFCLLIAVMIVESRIHCPRKEVLFK